MNAHHDPTANADAVVIIDAAGVIRSVSPEAEKEFGYIGAELVGQPIEILVPVRFRPHRLGTEGGLRSNATTRQIGAGLELLARCKDGSEHPVDVTLASLETDDGMLMSATIRSVPERKQIETDFPGLLEAAQDAIVAVDADGLIHLANSQAEALFGYARHELIGQPLNTLVPERARAVHLQHRAAYFAEPTTRTMGVDLQPTAMRKNGTEFPVDITLSSFETEDGRLVSATVRDVTTRKEVEEATRDEEQADFEAQLHQAQRLESIGQLAGGVAHDFNNLLAGIMNYAGLIAASLKEEVERRGLSEDEAFVILAQDVQEITNVAKRAAALTHQLLIFSRREVVQPEVLDLNSVVGDMEEMLRRTIGENVDDLRTILASELPLIRADRGQIEQVIMNLAVNARDAMPGGGTLQIETARCELDEQHARLRTIDAGDYVCLSVSDTGTGMTQEVAAKSFEPFFTTKPKGEGSGLGLATVYGIVTQAGGDIAITSSPGGGTTVRVYLPATKDNETEPRAGRPRPLPARGETVLIVEDEAIVREPTRRMLAKHGYTVLAAADAKEARAVLQQHAGTIDLLLTDVVMPGESGKQLSVDVVALRPAIKVLFMSGYSQDVIAHGGLLEEGVNLLEKPFSADDLLRKIRDVLDEGILVVDG